MQVIINQIGGENITNIKSNADLVCKFQGVHDREAQWLLAKIDKDGSIGSIADGEYFYKIPWTFSIVGETDSASKFLEWLKSNVLTYSGEFNRIFQLGSYYSRYTYIISNIVTSAQLLREFDIAQKGLRVLKRFYNPISGGYPNADIELKSNCWIESWITAQVSLSFLVSGGNSEAIEIGYFLERVFEMQKELPNKLYYIYNKDTQCLITKCDIDETKFVISKDKERQAFYAPILISGFLCRLYQATNMIRFLNLVRKYQDFVQNCTEKQFNGIEVCKTGWGAALLYQVTRNSKYLDWAIKVRNFFTKTQDRNGSWKDNRFSNSSLGQDVALTSQNVIWIDSIITALSVSCLPNN